MATRAIAYGAVELKQAMHRYWMYGFLLSAFLHLLLVGAFHFRWVVGDISLPQDIPLFHGGLQLIPQPPGLNEPVGQGSGHTSFKVKGAVPIPVPDNLADPKKTMPTQGELGHGVIIGGEGNNGAVGSEGTGTVVVDEMPVDSFRVVERYPEVVKSFTPVYPPMAIRLGLEGRVSMKVWVDRNGKVRQAVVEKTTDELFNESAKEAAMQFVFTPAVESSGPVPIWVHFPMTFRLRR